jgi:aspartokinase
MTKINLKAIERLLEKSTKVRADVSIIVLDINPIDLIEILNKLESEIIKHRILQIAEGEHMVSIICDDPLALRLSKEYGKRLISYKKNMAAITMSSPKTAVDTPGILAYIFTKFAENDVNIVEVISCHSDVSFIIDRKDAFKARNLLGKLI